MSSPPTDPAGEPGKVTLPVPPAPVQGPRPLAMHLAVQTWAWMTSLAALPFLSSGSPIWRPPLATRAEALARDLAAADPDAFRAAVDRETRRRLASFADGVERYRAAPRPPRPAPAPELIWQAGTTRLLDYGATAPRRPKKTAPAVLLVPSLVNRAHVLDLTAERSLCRSLAATGLRPFLIDWDAPGPSERGFDVGAYISQRLEPALDQVRAAAGRRPAVVGYCMGGNIVLGLAARRAADIRALALLATPWDFAAIDGGQRALLGASRPATEMLIAANGGLPVDLLQAMFAGLDPFLTPRKFRRFARPGLAEEERRAFVVLEDWLNDGVPLTAPVARECLFGWYLENRPAAGTWEVAGVPVRPEAIELPSLVVLPLRDHIVPPDSARPLAHALPRAELWELPAGHIGMVTGSTAAERLFRPLSGWLADAGRH